MQALSQSMAKLFFVSDMVQFSNKTPKTYSTCLQSLYVSSITSKEENMYLLNILWFESGLWALLFGVESHAAQEKTNIAPE